MPQKCIRFDDKLADVIRSFLGSFLTIADYINVLYPSSIVGDSVVDVHLAEVPEVMRSEHEPTSLLHPPQVHAGTREEVSIASLLAVEPGTEIHVWTGGPGDNFDVVRQVSIEDSAELKLVFDSFVAIFCFYKTFGSVNANSLL